MILDTINRSIEILLSAAHATAASPWVTAYADHTASAFTPASSNGATNGTTPVTAVAAPAGSTQRQVKFFNLVNGDTAPMTLTVRLLDGATTRNLKVVTLAVSDCLQWTSETGWTVTDNAGNLRSLTGLAGTGDDLMMGTHVYGGGGLNVVYTPGVIGATALTTGAPSLGNIRAIPFVAPRRPGVTLANIYINVTTGLAGNLRLGLYRRTSESNIYPGSLIYGSGDIDTSAAAVKTSAANKQLNPGEVYWLATNNSNGCTVRCAALAGIETMCGIGPTMPTTPNLPLLAVASAYGALPDPFPAGGAFATAVPFPVLGCSFSA